MTAVPGPTGNGSYTAGMVASMAAEWAFSALRRRISHNTPTPPAPSPEGDGWLRSVAQLDDLPTKTVVETGTGIVFQLWPERRWYAVADRRAYTSAQVLYGMDATGSGRARVLA